MYRLCAFIVLGVGLLVTGPGVGMPMLARQLPPGTDPILVGRWQVTFINGVIEKCVVKADGFAHESEPLRESAGKAVVQDNSAIITFEDDRVERWTIINGQMIVEHWCPASAYPTSRAVVGVAKLTR